MDLWRDRLIQLYFVALEVPKTEGHELSTFEHCPRQQLGKRAACERQVLLSTSGKLLFCCYHKGSCKCVVARIRAQTIRLKRQYKRLAVFHLECVVCELSDCSNHSKGAAGFFANLMHQSSPFIYSKQILYSGYATKLALIAPSIRFYGAWPSFQSQSASLP